jgi:hypothetical protein
LMKIKIDKLDIIWAKMVRERDGCCANCGKRPPYQLQAHHVMPRSRSSTRFLLDNGITLCAHCHTLGDKSVHRIGKQFCIDLLGQKEYDRLEALSRVYKSRDKARKEFESIVYK